jgi:hypothetical protein
MTIVILSFFPLSLILGLIGKLFYSGRFNPTIPKTNTLSLCPCYFEVWLILDLVGWLVVWWRVILSTSTKWQMFLSFRSLEVCHQTLLFKVSIVSGVLVCLPSTSYLYDLEYKVCSEEVKGLLCAIEWLIPALHIMLDNVLVKPIRAS